MKSKLLHHDDGHKTFAVIFDTGDEFIEGLTKFAKENQLNSSHFTAIGAFKEVMLGFFDMDKKDYKKIPIKEQVEVLALVGDIALSEGKPKIHAHVVVGDSEAKTYGGHIMEAYVRPTLEVTVVETPDYLQRKTDEETGLALISV